MASQSPTTSISLPADIVEALSALADEVDEPIACIQRQVVRIAYQRGWTFDALVKDQPHAASFRLVVRITLTPKLNEQADALRGEAPLSKWFRAAAGRFLQLHEMGDRTIWSLRG